MDLEKKTPKGQLKNPYNDKVDQIAEDGHKKFMAAGCNGCHGGGGGGPPLTNDIWVYGADDDTLFRLVTLGSDEGGLFRVSEMRSPADGGIAGLLRFLWGER
jgi:mono/diheme cytochrome c family protein